ncbi:hypothetical protein ACNTMW_24410 [Planosporangium sp. 12N6]|uniref:hypothetical protein n=1 Tax=Planosporangium spinosum TaxID=3402278 RepID=UPI003CED84BE
MTHRIRPHAAVRRTMLQAGLHIASLSAAAFLATGALAGLAAGSHASARHTLTVATASDIDWP